MRAILKPGNVKIAPIIPQETAMQNLTMIFDAGPLKIVCVFFLIEFCCVIFATYDEETPRPSK